MTTPANRPLPQPSFGNVPDKYDQTWLTAFTSQLARRLSLLAGPNTVQQQILLQSPDGTVYQVTVSNSGTLTTAVATRGTVQPPI